MNRWKTSALCGLLALALAAVAGCQSGGSAGAANSGQTAGGSSPAPAASGNAAASGGKTAAQGTGDSAAGNASTGGSAAGSSTSGGSTSGDSSAAGAAQGTGNGASASASAGGNTGSGTASASGSADTGTSGPSGNASVTPPNVKLGQVTAMRLIDANSGWVGGHDWVARTDDAGNHWAVQYLGNSPLNVTQIFALNGQTAWFEAVNPSAPSTRRLYGTADGGKHWAPIGSVPNDSFLHFDSAKEGFAGNERTADGGKSWTKLPIPSGAVGDAYFHDAKNGWSVVNGSGQFSIERTVNGGKSWTAVMTRKTQPKVNRAVIRSAGTQDAWVELIGDSGMSQTGYSLFHTTDGGADWTIVLHNNTAGAGPGPGFTTQDKGSPAPGSAPGPLDVVNTHTAFVGGYCGACDNANTIGWTTDGGKTFTIGKTEFPGYAGAFIMMADSKSGWWLCTDVGNPSVLYTTSNGGATWVKAHTFDKPSQKN